MSPRPFSLLLAFLFVPFAGCDSSGSSSPAASAGVGARIVGNSTGAGDATALAVMQSLGMLADPGRQGHHLKDQALREQLFHMVCMHLIQKAFGSGSALVQGSSRIRRMAAVPSALKDTNDNGSNLDEVLRAELEALVKKVGWKVEEGLRSTFFPWIDSTADYSAPSPVSGPLLSHPVVETQEGRVSMRDVGDAMMAKLLFAGDLLALRRGDQLGSTARDGAFGMVLLHQAAAMEETLLTELFFDGDVVGRLSKPGQYDPSPTDATVMWLPSKFAVGNDPARSEEVLTYSLLDGASSLADLASVMRAAAQLAWTAERYPLPGVKELFEGDPFGYTSADPGQPGNPNDPKVTVDFETDVKPVLRKSCGVAFCHTGSQPEKSFSVDSYELVLKGGANTAASSSNPIVVKNDHKKSALYQVLVGRTSFALRMPLGGPPWLSATDTKLIADWIDQGAVKTKPKAPEPIATGRDLAKVMLANLRKLHLRADGAMDSRHEGDRASDYMSAEATGVTLQALAHAAFAMPDEPGFQATLADTAFVAAQRLINREGAVATGYDLTTSAAVGAGDLRSQTAMVAGVLAAARVLNRNDLRAQGLLAGQYLMEKFFDPANGYFRSVIDSQSILYTPRTLQLLLDALRETKMAGDQTAERLFNEFLVRIRPHLVFSDYSPSEPNSDGNPDTNGNGIPEPLAAGGRFGRAPLFFGLLRVGPEPSGDTQRLITWSEDILPLFQETCAGCHVNGARRGNYRVDTPTLSDVPGDSGGRYPLIVPGNANGSLLFQKLRDRQPVVGGQMPLQRPPLNARGLELVRRWIDEGASRR